MSTTEYTTGGERPQITGWDPEGSPMFASDQLDKRYAEMLDRMRVSGVDALTVDMGVGELVYGEDGLVHADEALEILAALVARERVRREVIDQELGLR